MRLLLPLVYKQCAPWCSLPMHLILPRFVPISDMVGVAVQWYSPSTSHIENHSVASLHSKVQRVLAAFSQMYLSVHHDKEGDMSSTQVENRCIREPHNFFKGVILVNRRVS